MSICAPYLARSARCEGSPVVTIVDLDVKSGKFLLRGSDATVASAPGSTLKPFVLLTALRSGEVTRETRLFCSGSLHVGSRNLACSHPASLHVFSASEALAYSCNSYFAQVAARMSPVLMRESFSTFGIHTDSPVVSPEQRMLLVLGVERILLTPIEMAKAYARLGQELEQPSPYGDAVRAGLLGSVQYGMARGARTEDVQLGGKTGTTHDPFPMVQHGWFAGIVFGPQTRPSHVIVVYAPGGNGNDAALAAHAYLSSRRWK